MGLIEDCWVCVKTFNGPGAALRLLLELGEVKGWGSGGGGVPNTTAGTVLLVGVCLGSGDPKLSFASRSNRLSFLELAASRSSSSSCSSMIFAVLVISFREDPLMCLEPRDGREGGVDTGVLDEDCSAELRGGVRGSVGTGTRVIE